MDEVVDSSGDEPVEFDDLPKPTFDELKPEAKKDESSSLYKPTFSNQSSADKDEVNMEEVIKSVVNMGAGPLGEPKDKGMDPLPSELFEGTTANLPLRKRIYFGNCLIVARMLCHHMQPRLSWTWYSKLKI